MITHTHLEPDILECEVKWALGSITMTKASGGDGISVELFQILKDDAVKVLLSIFQQIWKTQQWPQDWTMSVFISGLPFPSTMHEVKSESEVAQSCPTLRDPMDCSLPGSSIHGIFPGKSTGVGCHCLLLNFHLSYDNNAIKHPRN